MERRTGLIAVYGGTFDPVHLGHLHLAQSLLKRFHFDKFYFVPARLNPLKIEGPCISESNRLRLLKAAVLEMKDARIEVLDCELKREGPSYTVDTLEALKKNTDGELVLILGNEVFAELARWKEPGKLLRLTNLLVINRHPEISCDPIETLRQLGILDFKLSEGRVSHSKNSHWIESVEIAALPYSSTEIREHISKAWNTGHLENPIPGLQRSVWLLIKENQLYAVKRES